MDCEWCGNKIPKTNEIVGYERHFQTDLINGTEIIEGPTQTETKWFCSVECRYRYLYLP